MSKILPDGFVNTDVISDFSLFSLNNTIIGQYAGKVIKGNNNLFIGNNAGKIGVNINNSILIGNESCDKIIDATNTISIGYENTSIRTLNNFVNIGFNNVNQSSNVVNITNDKPILSINNIGLKNQGFSEIIIGNHNSNINSLISIGTSNISSIENSILLGNNINNNKFTLNIDNSLCKSNIIDDNDNDKEIIYLACGAYKDFPVILGFSSNPSLNTNLSIEGNFISSIFKIKNSNNNSITFKTNTNIDLIYNFPNLPAFESSYLSIDNNGNLIWLPIQENMIKIINSTANIICNNIDAINIIGDGRFIENIRLNLENKTTDDLYEGINNLYIRQSFISNIFYNYLLNISTNNISQGNNKYFSSNSYKNNFYENLNDISTDNLNNDNFYSSNIYDTYAFEYINLSNLTTDNIKKGSSNLYYDISKIIFNFDVINEGTSNKYFNQSNYNYLINSNFNNKITDNIKQGSSNLYYNNTNISSNIANNFNNITTDNLRESSNIYMNYLNVYNFMSSNYPTTDDIKKGSDNEYLYSLNNSNKYQLISDNISTGTSNYYFTNSGDLINIISTISSTDYFKEGNCNLYFNETRGLNFFNSNLQTSITTDSIIKGSSNKFIENNFYNNSLEIKGFLKTDDLYILNNPIDLSIGIRDSNLLPTIGPNTQVFDVYDFNRLSINSRLSNIEIYYSNVNPNIDNPTVPFIIINDNVGINTANPKEKLDVNGNLLVRNGFFTSSTDYKYNDNSLFQYLPANTPTSKFGTLTYINQSNYYIQLTQSDVLEIPFSIHCECLIVGAGGRGGIKSYSGGGGAGEVIYIPSLYLSNGFYNINIGIDSPITSNRISKITNNKTGEIIINALGGGDGGYLIDRLITSSNYFIDNNAYALINKTRTQLLINGNNQIIMGNNQISINSISYNETLPVINKTPYLWGKLTENLLDSSGNNYTFNFLGLSSGTLTLPFENASIYLSSPHYLTLNAANNNLYDIWVSNGISISFWIKLKNTLNTNIRYIFQFSSDISNYWWIITADETNNNLKFEIKTITTASYTTTSDINIFNNTLHHIIWSISTSGDWKIYINKNLVFSGLKQSLPNLNYNILYIGRSTDSSGNYLNGYLKDFRIYRGILTDTEIKELYYGRVEILKAPLSGGSGGGGYGDIDLIQPGAAKGIPFNSDYSKLNNGNIGSNFIYIKGGDGGSALPSGRFISTIIGSSLQVGKGGKGGVIVPQLDRNGVNYGDGGGGNGGLGYQGVIILKFSELYITKFLNHTNWQKLFNINVGSGLSIDTINDNLLSSVWTKTENNIWNNNQANVGIGMTNPLYKLDVASGSGETGGISQRFFSKINELTLSNTNNINICARFGSSIWCQSEIISSSDGRIKTNIKDIESSNALNTILKIKPKKYNYIDNSLNYNNDYHNYGFIAQDINEIIPETVSKVNHYIPNIYQYATVINSNELLLTSNLITDNNIEINDKIRIITNENGEEIYKIMDIRNNSIIIDGNLNNEINSKVFIYGTKVNDFQTISKDSIFTLNISATQELYKIIMKQQEEIEYLKSLIIK